MKWLQDNPLGLALAAVCGVFILLALGMTIVGSLPVSVNTEAEAAEVTSDSEASRTAGQIGPLSNYQVINEKPVFNESRQPVVEEDEELSEDDAVIEVTDAPDVRLTGVVITPGVKIASLTPADTNLETVMAHEGESLTGEFVGWQVTTVNPRMVVLQSRDGQSLELDLQVHDATIQEPPKPELSPAQTAMKAAQASNGEDSNTTGEDEEPLSRAEQIRQRIAERRAELRKEQEAQAGPTASNNKTSDYQNAIRAMMGSKKKDKNGNDNTDG